VSIGPRAHEQGVCTHIWNKVGFSLYIHDFNGFLCRFGGFYPFFRDLGPFLRPTLGRNLGDDKKIQAYINQELWRPWGRSVVV